MKKSKRFTLGPTALVIASLVGALQAAQTSNSTTLKHDVASVRTADRVLRFPADRSLGRLFVRNATEQWDLSATGWKEYAEAVGEVAVPAGHAIRLDMRDAATATDLASLSKLRSDDLQVIQLNQGRLVDTNLQVLAHLSGLKSLVIANTPIGSAGLAALSGLSMYG